MASRQKNIGTEKGSATRKKRAVASGRYSRGSGLCRRPTAESGKSSSEIAETPIAEATETRDELTDVMGCLKSNSTDYGSRDNWLRARTNGIGASDAAVVLGESDWDSPLSLYAKKIGLTPLDESESLAMEIGRGMEAVAANIYERYTGREVFDLGAYTIQRHKQFPFLTATLDRVVVDSEKGWGCCNLKCVGGAKSGDWETTAPRVYWIQEQAEMLVTGLKWASLGVIVSNYDFRWIDIPRDDDFIDNTLLPALIRFWGHVQCRIAPKPDGHPATSKALSKVYANEDGSTLVLPGEFYDLDVELLQLKQEIAEREFRKNWIENRIKAAIGFATTGLLPGTARYTWQLQGVAGGNYARVLRRKSVA